MSWDEDKSENDVENDDKGYVGGELRLERRTREAKNEDVHAREDEDKYKTKIEAAYEA